jgi:hypothetical protein
MPKISKDGKVLINRTRVDDEAWKDLSIIAKILTRKHKKRVIREDLVNTAIKAVAAYYKKELKLE